MIAPREFFRAVRLYAAAPREYHALLFAAYIRDPLGAALGRGIIILYRAAYGLVRPLVLRQFLRRLSRLNFTEIRGLGVRALSADLVGLTPAQRSELDASGAGEAVTIGEFDQDGLVRSFIGPIPGIECCASDDFLPRGRNRIFLEYYGGSLWVRKCFDRDVTGFARELRIHLHLLRSGAHVPALERINLQRREFSVAYSAWPSIETLLAHAGAPVRHREARKLPEYQARDSAGRAYFYFQAARERLDSVLGAESVRFVLSELHEIHRLGIEYGDLKYGNILLSPAHDRAMFLDFGSSRHHGLLSPALQREVFDLDIEKFNAMFGLAEPTRARMRRRLHGPDSPGGAARYTSFYAGAGLRYGTIWDLNSGSGKWRFIARRALGDLTGKRVLSLGTNAASVELEMLLAGASEVVAIEADERWKPHAELLRDMAQWSSGRELRLEYKVMDMRDVPRLDNLGRFDLITAFCSLYYLSEEEIRALLSALSGRAERFAWQCNTRTNISRDDPDQYRRASVQFAEQMLREAGYTVTAVAAPRGYGRPLITAQRREGSGA